MVGRGEVGEGEEVQGRLGDVGVGRVKEADGFGRRQMGLA